MVGPMPSPASVPSSYLQSMPGSAIATFLMTDIEGSTRLWEQHPDTMPDLLAAHDAILRAAVEGNGGAIVKTTGDGLLARFEEPASCLMAALAGQVGLTDLAEHPVAPLRARMALHTGTAHARDGDFFGPSLNRVARLLAIGHGGQVLLSGVAAVLVGDRLPTGAELLDLGEHWLRDLDQPEHAFQLVAPGLANTFPPLSSVGSVRTNLPAPATSFVGRERELADLDRRLATSRLVTLTGTGGTGKTRLALQAAGRLVERYRDGVWLAELAPVRDPDLVPQGVAAALGVREQPRATPLDTVVDYLRGKELVLLLDNCEHVVDAAAGLVEGLLAACPSLTIVATSREALGLPGESIFQVPSLGLPERTRSPDADDAQESTADEAETADAVRLFVDRAQAVAPGFTLTDANAPVVSEICRRLDGIPLAIELAAARVTILSPEEILQRLGDRFRLLTGGRRAAVPRQQTLQALIDWSWDLLAEDDRRLLRRLSVFAGGWTLDAATAVCGDGIGDATGVLDALGRLVDRSLVVVDPGTSTRYRLLETIRQYARDRLFESGEAEVLGRRHLDHFLALAERAGPALWGPGMIEWTKRLEVDEDNLRTAIEWALEVDAERAARLAVELSFFWQTRSTWAESVAWSTAAVDGVRALPPPSNELQGQRDAVTAMLMAATAFGVASRGAGDASNLAEESIVLARRSRDDGVLAQVLMRASTALAFSGRAGRSMELVDELVRVATAQRDYTALAMAASGRASHVVMHDPVAAVDLVNHASDDARRTGNPFTMGFAALSRGRVLGRVGRLAEAIPAFDEAFASFAELEGSYHSLMARSDLAHALRQGGRLDDAEATLRGTIRRWEHFGNRGAVANELEAFAFIALAHDDTDRATRLLAAAQALRDVASAHRMPHEALDFDMAVARLQGEMDPAAFERAWTAGRSMGTQEAVALALGDHPTR
jgi:predicted ATPase/class 3 adenylate cyclase